MHHVTNSPPKRRGILIGILVTFGLMVCFALLASLNGLSAAPFSVEAGEVDAVKEQGKLAEMAPNAFVMPISCGASGFLNWTTTSQSVEIVRQCTLEIPQDGLVFLSADGALTRLDGEYEVRYSIGIDNINGDINTIRYANLYDDAVDGTDKSIAVSVLKPITAGTHTFYMVAGRQNGAGTVAIRDPSLSVIFIPNTNTELLACGDSGNLDWRTSSSVFQVVRQCTLQIPQNGQVFLTADGSAGYYDGEYEAEFRFGVDDANGDLDSQRYINVYTDTLDGTDETLALSLFRVVTPGEHTFYLLGNRILGSGEVRIWNPTFTAIYIPLVDSAMATCWSKEQVWTSTSDTFEVVLQCMAQIPRSGWAFLSADGSAGNWDGEYEAVFQMQVDDASGNLQMNRWVNVYDDAADGTDKSFRVSGLARVEAGTHTFYLTGRRVYGLGTVLVTDPWINMLFIPDPATIYLPLLTK